MPRHLDFTDPELQHVLAWEQNGVVSRPQLLAMGATDHDIARMLRRRELSSPRDGVYLNHTGRPTRAQREWIALLAHWPAALSHESAMPGGDPVVVHLCIDQRRTLRRTSGVVLHRSSHLATRVNWNSRPPRVRPAHATLDVIEARIATGDVAAAYAALTRACFTREIGPDGLRGALAMRKRVAERKLVTGLIDDVENGACSVLEQGYLHRVERAHGLPAAERQHSSRATGGRTYQDVRYGEFGLLVELDGLAFHDSPEARDSDALRDLAECATSADITVRLTYGLVFTHGCRTARWLVQILRRRGWHGAPHPCPACAPNPQRR